MTLESLRAAHAKRVDDHERARARLAAAEADRKAAVRAFSDDASMVNRKAHHTADERVRNADLDVQAAKLKLDDAATELQTADRRESLATLAKHQADASEERVMGRLAPLLARIAAADRALAPVLEEARAICAEQRAARDRVERTAREMGEPLHVALAGIPDVHLDDVAAVAGITIARARAAEGRQGQAVELLLAPFSEPERGPNQAEEIERYERALRLLAATPIKETADAAQ